MATYVNNCVPLTQPLTVFVGDLKQYLNSYENSIIQCRDLTISCHNIDTDPILDMFLDLNKTYNVNICFKFISLDGNHVLAIFLLHFLLFYAQIKTVSFLAE